MKRSILTQSQKVKLSNFSDQVLGKFVKIDSDGSLVLAVSGGKQEKFFAGDVTILN